MNNKDTKKPTPKKRAKTLKPAKKLSAETRAEIAAQDAATEAEMARWARPWSPEELEQWRKAQLEQERARRQIDQANGAPARLARDMERVRQILEAKVQLQTATSTLKPKPSKRKRQRSPQSDLARRKIAELYPNGVPDAVAAETVKGKIAEALEKEGAPLPYPSWKTVNRALGR